MKRLNAEKGLWFRGAYWPNAYPPYTTYTIHKFEFATSLNLYPAMINENPRLVPFEYSDPYPDWYKKILTSYEKNKP